MNVAIVTARAGSKSIPLKNIHPVAGVPLVAYPLRAAAEARRIDLVFLDTDGEEIARIAEEKGIEVLWRPERLAGDEVNHGDVIRHDVHVLRERFPDLENVVVLLGNTVMTDAPLIDEALKMLDERPDLDSVMSVWEAGDDHPLRAMEIEGGLLRPYGGQRREASTSRQSYPAAYFYDQGVWAFRHSCVDRRDGPSPWWWMGRRSAPIVRPWVTGRDVHGGLDLAVSEWWICQSEHAEGSAPRR